MLPESHPEALGLDPAPLARMCSLIEKHIADGYHPGAQVALARHGKLALFKSFGKATVEPDRAADDRTLFLMYSNTKVVVTSVLWMLAEDGLLRFTDTVASLLPGFEANGKGDITIIQLLTHQGGFPSAMPTPAVWGDPAELRRQVCNFTLEWTPGSKVQYHPLAAHWVAAALINELTGQDYREVVRNRVILPLGLGDELFVGTPAEQQQRCAGIYDPPQGGKFPARGPENTPAFRQAGVPGGGGYGTARAMATFYQALGHGGAINGVRLVSPRTMEYVTRNFTGDRLDSYMGFQMNRGLGPHSRGTQDATRGLGTLAHPRTFGHGGVGSSYCWADPDSGVSFAFFSNCRQDGDWHNLRMDTISNLAHASIVE
jgi:CubicO group peptidase (beta-lactamase class C family)